MNLPHACAALQDVASCALLASDANRTVLRALVTTGFVSGMTLELSSP